MAHKACPECGLRDWAPFLGREHRLQCMSCRTVMKRSEVEPPKRKTHASRVAKRRVRSSQKSERKVASRVGDRVTPGSGNMDAPSVKGDIVVKDKLRAEHKETAASSISMKREWLEKIERQALANGEMPALYIQFNDQRREKVYVVLKEDDFLALLEGAT